MELDLTELEKDLIDLCEDNEGMKEAIRDYFNTLKDEFYFELKIVSK